MKINTKAIEDYSLAGILICYNEVADKKIKRFSDRKSAERRFIKLLESNPKYAKENGFLVEEKAPKSPSESLFAENKDPIIIDTNTSENALESLRNSDPAVIQPAKKEKRESTGKRGRPSIFAGKILFTELDFNPRRPGTFGHTSFSIIEKGEISYEEYLVKGGRNQDLLWDVGRGWALVKDSIK